MKLVEGFDSNYRYVLVAARRARQIQNGARPVVEPHSRKPCRIAEEEIQAGRVKWKFHPPPPPLLWTRLPSLPARWVATPTISANRLQADRCGSPAKGIRDFLSRLRIS